MPKCGGVREVVVDRRLHRQKESVRAYTYGISTVGSVLDLGLVEFHLLLLEDGLHLFVFLFDDVEQVLCEHLGALDLSFIGTSATNEQTFMVRRLCTHVT